MAVTLGTESYGVVSASSSAPTVTESVSHTVSGSDRVLTVIVLNGFGNPTGHFDTTGVSYGGTPLTLAESATKGNTSNYGIMNVQVWYLLDPPVGTANVAVTITNSNASSNGYALFIQNATWNGCDVTGIVGSYSSVYGSPDTGTYGGSVSAIAGLAAGDAVVGAGTEIAPFVPGSPTYTDTPLTMPPPFAFYNWVPLYRICGSVTDAMEWTYPSGTWALPAAAFLGVRSTEGGAVSHLFNLT